MNRTQLIGINLLVVILAAIGVGTGWYFFNSNRDLEMKDTFGAAPMTIYRSGPFRIGVRVTPEVPVVGDNKFQLQLQDNEGKPILRFDV